jgi:hypothetical protein
MDEHGALGHSDAAEPEGQAFLKLVNVVAEANADFHGVEAEWRNRKGIGPRLGRWRPVDM